MVVVNPDDYRGRRTLIVGDVNSGKTKLTADIVAAFIAAGDRAHLAIVDLAPEPVGGVGGKFAPLPPGVRYLTCSIAAPRLTGRSDGQIQALAATNAARIENLLQAVSGDPPQILVVNDATLYLQAGSLARFTALLDASPTAVVNAYRGSHFADGPLSRHERELTDLLALSFDVVKRL